MILQWFFPAIIYNLLTYYLITPERIWILVMFEFYLHVWNSPIIKLVRSMQKEIDYTVIKTVRNYVSK